MTGLRVRCTIALVAMLGGCHTATPEQQAALRAQAGRPVYCVGFEDCQIRWGRVLQWVKENSAYKFDQATESLISTKGPLPDDPRPAFTVTKVAQGGGRYVIDFDGGCDNVFGCIPTMLEAKASFVVYVMGQVPSMPAAQPATTPGMTPAPGQPVLGVAIVPVPPSLKTMLKVDAGLLVVTVTPGSAAALAGLKAGDVILKFNGTAIATPQDLNKLLATTQAGSAATLTMQRGMDQSSVPVTLQAASP